MFSVLLMLFNSHILFADPMNWYDNLTFKDPSFSFELARTMGYAYSGAADIGESISTARSIKDGDVDSWYQHWLDTANRLYTFAESKKEKGDTISASEAFFRASNYYRTAGLYMVAEKDRPKSISAYAKSKKSFLQGVAYLPHVRVVKIPYENTTLPGYFIPSSSKNAPLFIVHSGFDGTAEEIYFEVGIAAHKHGYNVLLFEGPGQGNVIRQQHLVFRPDWEHVVTPVVDFAMGIPNIDKHKIALLGISMGGYLAARACAFEHRIQACIVNGGVYDISENIYKNTPANMLSLLKTDPNKFNSEMAEEMKKDLTAQWFFNNAMWTFGAKSPAEVMEKIKLYSMKDSIDNIKCPMLVIDSEADMFYKGQPEKVYNSLKSPKTLLKFTREQTAEAHCQMGAIAISNEMILDWLDHTLKD